MISKYSLEYMILNRIDLSSIIVILNLMCLKCKKSSRGFSQRRKTKFLGLENIIILTLWLTQMNRGLSRRIHHIQVYQHNHCPSTRALRMCQSIMNQVKIEFLNEVKIKIKPNLRLCSQKRLNK